MISRESIRTRSIGAQPFRKTSYRALQASKAVPPLVRWSLLLFVFTIPFESADLSFTSETLALPKITGLFFIVSYFFYHGAFFLHESRPRFLPGPPKAMWWFLGYLGVYVFNVFFISEAVMLSFVSRFITLLQLIVLFWPASRLLEDEKLSRAVLLVFSLSTVLLAAGMLLDLPGFSQTVADRVGERSTALGQNANALAIVMAPAAVILIGLVLSAIFKHLWIKLVLAGLTVPLVVAIVRTGSRAGIFVFMIGCLTYLLPFARSKHRITVFTVIGCAMIAMAFFIVQSDTASTRLEMTLVEGHTSGRDAIFSTAIDMFLEKPIRGWQPYDFQFELGRRLGVIFGQRDAHNLYLHLLLEVGAVGATCFFIGLWLCGQSAWRARNTSFGLLPMAVLLTILVANLSGTGLARKTLWLILAFATATGAGARDLKPETFAAARLLRGAA